MGTPEAGFLQPQWLWLLLALPLLAALSPWFAAIRRRRLERFAAKETWPVLNATVAPGARFHKSLLLLLAFALSAVAAARPYWGTQERELRRRGIDLIVGIDVSRSMLAADMPPTRLETAKRLAAELATRFRGQRFGLLPFAGDAFLQTPLTADYGLFLDSLRALDSSTIGTPGSDLGVAIDTAVNAFARSSQGTRVLLLITDGEDHEATVAQAAKNAAEKGVIVYAIGIGSVQGAPIRQADGSFFEDANGTKVVTRLDVETLRSIANATGGASYTVEPGQRLDLAPLVASLDSLQKGELGAQVRAIPNERYQWPLGAALLLLLLESAIRERRRAPRANATPMQEARA